LPTELEKKSKKPVILKSLFSGVYKVAKKVSHYQMITKSY